ncbi:hypothetical protein QQF64_008140 [Cirrhinus molitorella]|uniref:Uncharacterized protein n=1 Tax=Cirrhinus molitorella TaxID=172907 RepID=A0ABR3M9B3_9TELE
MLKDSHLSVCTRSHHSCAHLTRGHTGARRRRACVRARCHLLAPEEGTVTSRFEWRQRSLGNRPVLSQSVRFLNQSGERRQRQRQRRRSWPSQGSGAHFSGSP